jgi:hypothetical protein
MFSVSVDRDNLFDGLTVEEYAQKKMKEAMIESLFGSILELSCDIHNKSPEVTFAKEKLVDGEDNSITIDYCCDEFQRKCGQLLIE